MSNSGPYGPPVMSVQLAGWHWPLKLHINSTPDPGEPTVTLSCGRGHCGMPLLELSDRELASGWAFDPAEFADYGAAHLPECRSGTVRHIF
jgi:hypothetical protein